MKYILSVDTNWMDTSLGPYDGAIVEIIKESRGRQVADHGKDDGLPAKISISKHCNIKAVKDGAYFYNIPKSWLIEWPIKNK